MTPADFIASLRERGIQISATSTGKVRVSPRTKLTSEEREFLASDSKHILNALVASELVGLLIANSESIEDRLERKTREAVQRDSRYPMFHTRRGLLHLEELSDDEARRLAARGRLSEAEVREWWTWRQRRLQFPAETVRRMFLLKARRAGFHHLVAHFDGRVVLS